MDLKTLSVEALKSLAYDQIVVLNQTQKNIQIIEAEIVERNGEPKEVEPVKE